MRSIIWKAYPSLSAVCLYKYESDDQIEDDRQSSAAECIGKLGLYMIDMVRC